MKVDEYRGGPDLAAADESPVRAFLPEPGGGPSRQSTGHGDKPSHPVRSSRAARGPNAGDASPPASHPAPGPSPVRTSAPSRRTGLRILFAEDDSFVARSLTGLLRRAGHHVTHARDGVAAMEHFETELEPYDLLLLDLHMPRMGGVQVAQRARESGYTGRIIVISGRAAAADIKALQALKLERILFKPFLPRELMIAVQGT